MVEVSQRDGSVETRVLISLVLTTLFFTVFSILIITYITGNFYASSYYTLAALFDAVGIDQGAVIASAVPVFSIPFDVIVTLSAFDGLIKIIIIGFFLATLINIITSFDIGTKLAVLSRRRWKGHVVICGYSLLAEKVAMELVGKKIPFIIVDRDESKTDEIKEAGYAALHEDFTTDMALKNAYVDSAKSVMFLTYNDYDNLLGVITARHISSNVKIIARASDSNTITKIHRAGAELCVVPEVLAGIDLGEAIASKGLK